MNNIMKEYKIVSGADVIPSNVQTCINDHLRYIIIVVCAVQYYNNSLGRGAMMEIARREYVKRSDEIRNIFFCEREF